MVRDTPAAKFHYARGVYATRFAELAYTKEDSWRFIDTSTGCSVGPYYATRAALVADTERYADMFGCR